MAGIGKLNFTEMIFYSLVVCINARFQCYKIDKLNSKYVIGNVRLLKVIKCVLHLSYEVESKKISKRDVLKIY